MKLPKVYYNGKLFTIDEAIPLLTRQMIEVDLPKRPDFKPKKNPYEYLCNKIAEIRNTPINEPTIRKWCLEKEKGGAFPNIEDFFLIIYITKSKTPLKFIGSLIGEYKPEKHTNIYDSVYIEIGDFIQEMGKQLKAMAPDKNNWAMRN